MTDRIQALAQSIAEEFGAITVGGRGDTRGEYTVVDASPEEVAAFLAPKLARPEWIDMKDRLPTDDEVRTNRGPHVHCWCYSSTRGMVHLAWNPFYQCWDDEDGDDVSDIDGTVTHWQPMNMPTTMPEVKP